MTDIFLSHFSEDSKRIDENSVKAAKEKLKRNKMLVITGPAESGKTSLAVALAKSYAKDEVLMFCSPDKIESIDFQRTSLVIIDDFVGKYGFQKKKVIKWFLRFDQLYLAVAAGKLNIIVTCETSKLEKCNKKIKSHPLLSYPLVLTKLATYVKQESSEETGILEGENENGKEKDKEKSKEKDEETDKHKNETEGDEKEKDEEKEDEEDEEEYEEKDVEKSEEKGSKEEYEDEKQDKDEEEVEVERNPLFLPPRQPHKHSEELERPDGSDSFFQMNPGAESVSANASENIRYVTSLKQNSLTTNPKACCMLPDSEILLQIIGGHLIKLDSTYKEVCYSWTYYNTTGVCYIGNNTAIVCANKQLVYVDVDSMKEIKTMYTNLYSVKFRSIAFNKENVYLLSDDCVYTYSVKSTGLSLLFVRGLRLLWNCQESTLKNMTVSYDGSKVYIITCDDELITIDSSGNHLNTLSLSFPRCICVDDRGNVWVGNLSGEVYQVSADGARIRNKISAETRYVLRTICYDRNTSSLIATSGKKIIALKLN